MEEGDGDAEVAREMQDVDVDGEVAREMEERNGDAEVAREMEEGNGDGNGAKEVEESGGDVEGAKEVDDSDVAKQVEDVVGQGDCNANDVDDVEVHDVHDFELKDDEDVDEEVSQEVEFECESMSEESLVDVTIQCDIGTSKGKCSRATDTYSIHDVRGLYDIEWFSNELVSVTDSEEETKNIGTYGSKVFGANRKYKWYAYCVFMCGVKSWQLRKIIDVHSCTRDFNVKLMTSKYMSQKMEKTVRENPNMKVMDIRNKVNRKWNVGISRNMAFRARAIAKDNVEGPISGLDECFLKGKYGGELLTAVRRDVNKQILPIAYAVVEVENKDSWTWFLKLLIQDLGREVVCASVTRGIYPQQWEYETRNIKEVNLEAFKYLIAIPPKYAFTVSRSRFTPTLKYDTLASNMCEHFNSVLVHTRSKPIITILEDIKVYIMKR
ncbi:hypothetical protein V8G54_021481 [Vigna mungo]|uniref:MULE transposase domain-containing protein n=1 Tax=Vigna mungo TaxID=3915 RepID=A0AAQ3NE72_VIGMU